jgi:hypothetical protein
MDGFCGSTPVPRSSSTSENGGARGRDLLAFFDENRRQVKVAMHLAAITGETADGGASQAARTETLRRSSANRSTVRGGRP